MAGDSGLGRGQPARHQGDGGPGDQGFGDLREAFVVAHVAPGHVTNAVSALFAEEAQARDRLTLDRTLTPDEYESIRDVLATWAQHDRSHGDVLDAFGTPSIWFGSRQPRHGKALGYFSERSEGPAIVIHLWNEDTYSSAHDYQAPVIAARCGHGPLPVTFVFTPEGARTRPAA